MQKVGLEAEPCNPIVDAFAKSMIYALIAISRHPEALAATRKILGIVETPVQAPKTTGLSKQQLRIAVGLSTSTIDRLDNEGAPHIYCGDSRRYDLNEYRAWLAHRGKKPTKAKPGDANIGDVAQLAGLRGAL